MNESNSIIQFQPQDKLGNGIMAHWSLTNLQIRKKKEKNKKYSQFPVSLVCNNTPGPVSQWW